MAINLMRPEQVMDTKDEVKRMEDTLVSPLAAKSGFDRPLMHRQLNQLKQTLEDTAPKAFAVNDLDKAVQREQELLGDILEGMPTQAEMRKNPPGAVSKHMKWETRNKDKIAEWKNLMLRLHAGDSDADIANLERHRPVGGAQELSMAGAQIEGKQYHNLEPASIASGVIINDEAKAKLQAVAPELAGRLATFNNDQRAAVMDFIDNLDKGLTVDLSEKRKGMSDENRKKASERAKKMWADKRKAKAEANEAEQKAARAAEQENE